MIIAVEIVKCKNKLREPGIEPGAQPWEDWILPLNHSRRL